MPMVRMVRAMELFCRCFFSEFLFKISYEFTNIGHCITVPDIIHTDILLKSRLVEVFSFSGQSELKLLNWHRDGGQAQCW